MFRKHLQPKIFLKNTLAALLVITLSGVYCLFCCPEVRAAVGPETEHCPFSKPAQTEHCNPSKNNALETAASIRLFECCGLPFNFFVAKLEKNEFPQQQTPALAKNFFNFSGPVKPASSARATAFSYRAPVLETRDLHLRNCVFRI
jgi:hypothetical protein